MKTLKFKEIFPGNKFYINKNHYIKIQKVYPHYRGVFNAVSIDTGQLIYIDDHTYVELD